MREQLSSAVQDKRPTLLIGEDGTFREVDSEDTDAFHRQQLARKILDFQDFEPHNERNSARMTAAAKLEEALLDLDERGAGSEEKAEVEAALEAVTTIEPDKERGLSRIGVAAKEVERLERYVKSFRETGDGRLNDAISRLNSARLVVGVLTATEREQTAINLQHDSSIMAQIANADAHNDLVIRNRHRRNALTREAAKDMDASHSNERAADNETTNEQHEPHYNLVESVPEAKDLIYSNPDYLTELIDESEAYTKFSADKMDTSNAAISSNLRAMARDLPEVRQAVQNWRETSGMSFKQYIEAVGAGDIEATRDQQNAAYSVKMMLRNTFWRESSMARRMARKIANKSEVGDINKAFAAEYFRHNTL